MLYSEVYKNFDATVQKFSLELEKLRLIPSFPKAVFACATLFLASASFALVCDFKLCVKMTISRVVPSIFNDFTC